MNKWIQNKQRIVPPKWKLYTGVNKDGHAWSKIACTWEDGREAGKKWVMESNYPVIGEAKPTDQKLAGPFLAC